MPKPTVTNRIAFKNYLRANKQKFTSGIQTCIFGDIEDVILDIAPGVSTSQITRVIIFDDNERVGLSTILNQRQLFYVPALPNDSIIIGVGTDGDPGIKSSRGYRLDFIGDGEGVLYGGQLYGLNTKIGLGTDVSLKVLGLGGGLFLPEDPPSFSVTPSITTVTEGNPVSFTVSTSNLQSGARLYYNIVGSASSSDFLDNTLSGSFIVGSSGVSTFTKTIKSDSEYNEFVEGFRVNILSGSSTGSIVATSSTVFITNLEPPSFSLSQSSTSITEGESVNVVVNTTNVGAGTTLYYTIIGTASSNDFADNSLNGSFNIVSIGPTTGVGTITKTTVNDVLTEGNETFQIQVRTGSINGSIVGTSSTITIVDLPRNYAITPSTNAIQEGQTVTFAVSTTNVPNGTYLYYSITGNVSSEDFTDNALNGAVIINNNSASFTKTATSDLSFESTESFQVELRRDSYSGTIIATSPTITITNVIPTYSLTYVETSLDEGSSITFTFNAAGVANGTAFYFTTNGDVLPGDFSDSTLNGSFSVYNNVGTFTRTIFNDRFTEGSEEFIIEVRRDSTSGFVVARSNVIVIKDTSRDVGETANGLTFGPIQVNRDNGNPNIASDWYSICGIDNLPENSKIALFIDTSGSMTQATIQASYDLLLSKLAKKNISIITVTNSNEDWITPFLTDLS